ncbi:MAG: Hpt domain-containing protein [Acidobacteria bacterium]|nr:Hpt domain-containing protein [Acidobacteriota bacterium]
MDFEFEELKKEFLNEAKEKIVEMRAIVEAGFDEGDSLERLTNLAHQLKGSGGSYGYARISSDGARLEEILEGDGSADREGVERGLSDLEDEVARQLAAFDS